MSVDRLLDQLVAAAAISPEQAQLARALPPNAASTAVGRLEASGADVNAALAAVAQVSGIAVAPAALVERAHRVAVKGGDPAVLRRLLAYPAGVDRERVLDILVADPEAATHLPHLGLPSYRVWLAAETVVRALIARLPESGPEIVTGVEDQMRMLRAIDYDTAPLRTGLELGGSPSGEQEQFITARDLVAGPAAAREVPAPAPLPPFTRTPTPQGAPARAATPQPFGAGPSAPQPLTPAPVPRTATPGTATQARPGVAPQAFGARDLAAAVADLPPAITLLPPMKEAHTEAAPQVARVEPLGKPSHPADLDGNRKGLLLPLLAAGGGLVAVGAVIVALTMGGEVAPVGDPALEKQRELLEQARKHAAAGDNAWAFSTCTDAIAAKPGSTLAYDAALICAKVRIELGERLDAAEQLRKLIAVLPSTDPRRAQAEQLLSTIVGAPPAPTP
ncbi:MAG: hypothetical protein IT383_16720 [Deltaproteobacteria bacterium]|nr:hypothetical protein [Deltaproteobacteria bacterium]